MLEWITNNETLLWWLFVISIGSLLITLITVPVVLIRLPQDYFDHSRRHYLQWEHHHHLLRLPLLIVKNLIGIILLLLGVAMLVLPGQGLLTIIIGLVLTDFPGKFKLERWVISRPAVLQSINWIRVKAGKPALIDSR